MTSGVLGKKTKIIAEIGLVHEGSLGLAMSMAQSAISSGADIIKFQAHFPKHESSSKELFRTRFSKQDSSRWDYWERTSFSESQWAQLKQVVEDLGGVFLPISCKLKHVKDILRILTKDTSRYRFLYQVYT